ncbi:MAG TPA: flagellar FliJ family protein [Micropepsaceae bacterium]|nr:flagellar FliJ family protein [Micropepsaceae bacterium]
MKRRGSLLRLKRFRVDELKRRLGTLDEMKTDLEKKLTDLEDSVVRERQRANDSDIGRLAFPSFLQSIEVRRKNIRTTMADLERERAAQQDDLSAAFQDLKSFELAEEERLRRAAEAEARQQQSRMDEIAMVRHLRKHSARKVG